MSAAPSFADPPFACPPDDWVFDIPLPPSVNRTRKVHWAGHRRHEAWRNAAGWHLRANPRRLQRYELTITLDRNL